MNKIKLPIVAAIAAAAVAAAGCLNNFTGAYPTLIGTKTTTVYLNGDTNKIDRIISEPAYGYQWHNDLMRLAYDTHADSVRATYGDASFEMNGYTSSATNAPAIISAGGSAVGTVIGAAAAAAAK